MKVKVIFDLYEKCMLWPDGLVRFVFNRAG